MAKANWIWYGYPGHFIGSSSCQFRMCTEVNGYLISTVGDYRPYENKPAKEIGINRLYETMVFRITGRCTAKGCDCNMPNINGSELEMVPANTPGEAQAGHLAMCAKYDRKRAAVTVDSAL